MDLSAKVVEVLKQKNNNPMSFEKQTVSLFFITKKEFIENIPLDRISEAEEKLIFNLENSKNNILNRIKDSKKIEDNVKSELEKFIADFVESFLR